MFNGGSTTRRLTRWDTVNAEIKILSVGWHGALALQMVLSAADSENVTYIIYIYLYLYKGGSMTKRSRDGTRWTKKL